MSANDKQVGGTHYQTGGMQHWDLMARLYGDAHFKCAATKYICRWTKKGGVQDLEKALHYLEKLKELYRNDKIRLIGRHVTAEVWLEMCGGDPINTKLCKRVAEIGTYATLDEAVRELNSLISTARASLRPSP